MKQLIIPDKVQKEMLADFMIMGETRGLIGGYCEDEFPVYYANEEMARNGAADHEEKTPSDAEKRKQPIDHQVQ